LQQSSRLAVDPNDSSAHRRPRAARPTAPSDDQVSRRITAERLGHAARTARPCVCATTCRGSPTAAPVEQLRRCWGVTGYALFDDGTETVFAVSNLVGGHAVAMDSRRRAAGRRVEREMWFAITNEWGSSRTTRTTATTTRSRSIATGLGATLVFGSTGASRNPPRSMRDKIVVHYAPQRLQQCQAETTRWPRGASRCTGKSTAAPCTTSPPRGPTERSSRIRSDRHRAARHDLAMWFEATSVYGCHAYDSDYKRELSRRDRLAVSAHVWSRSHSARTPHAARCLAARGASLHSSMRFRPHDGAWCRLTRSRGARHCGRALYLVRSSQPAPVGRGA